VFHIPRDLFRSFAAVLKNHHLFHKRGLKQRKHFTSELHLPVLLKYMGLEGNAASLLNVKQGLGIGKGSVKNYLERAVDAVLSLTLFFGLVKRSAWRLHSVSMRNIISQSVLDMWMEPV
jgi:hypothetical protein